MARFVQFCCQGKLGARERVHHRGEVSRDAFVPLYDLLARREVALHAHNVLFPNVQRVREAALLLVGLGMALYDCGLHGLHFIGSEQSALLHVIQAPLETLALARGMLHGFGQASQLGGGLGQIGHQNAVFF